MNKEYRAYRILYFFVNVLRLVFNIKPVGRENIPEGHAVICATHSSWTDPFLLILAFGKSVHLHIMAKKELFRIPVIAGAMRRIGSFGVDRGNNDISAIRTSLKYLKKGEKIAMFPEGTRVPTDEASVAKNGAVRIAEKASAPIVPVYIPRKKRLFSRQVIVIGEPYYINPEKTKLTTKEFNVIADEMMKRIIALKDTAGV